MNDRYFTLRAHLYEREENLTMNVKLSEIEEIWHCTRKNVKRILLKLQQQELLEYKPGIGRGRSSQLTFFHPFQQEVEQHVQTHVRNGQLDQVAELLRLPIPKSWIAKKSKEIEDMFGYKGSQQSEDVLHAFISRSITTIDPLKVSVSLESHIIEQLGSTLVEYDAETDTIQPLLAHHYESDENDRVWTFYLRKGVRFHHNEEMTSEDVKATLYRGKEGPPSYSWLMQELSEIECVGRYKVIVYLSNPNPFFIRYLASSNLCILPADVPFTEKDWIGTGPFQLVEKNDHKLVLSAFDRYFKERPLLDEVHFYQVSQEAAETMNFTPGVKNEMRPTEKHELETGFRFLAFNFNRDTIVQNASFREAVFHLLDMNKMAEALEWSTWVEASSFVHERSFHQPKEDNKIIEGLKESGYNGEALTLYHLDFARAAAEASWFQSRAERFGLRITLVPYSLSDFYNKTMDEEADLIFMGEVSSLDSHLSFIGAFQNETLFFHRLFPESTLQWIHERLRTLKKQPHATDRVRVMKDIERVIREDHLLIFQHHPVKTRTFHPMIQDVEFHSFGHFDLTKLWIPN
ncbi:ABC transporter substrate-binding protein [Halobacillus litoralis]|uniref:ABC transporter substrate-binding protein n=1 Tax=Halobacillus litoralis TaxID=45668 RepID=UPI001CD76DC3|nr:ABC transporter substrate-binding protein [Halobacillus litoralis]MCA0969540.1 ABC transporter substrate-binding protein [Halobacillus litoralis]